MRNEGVLYAMMKNIVDFLKLPSKVIGAVAIASGVLIFLPQNVIDSLYMKEFKDQYGFVVGLAFIISVSILSSDIIISSYKYIKRRFNKKKLKKNQLKFLSQLNDEEKYLLSELMSKSGYTMELPMQHGTVLKLKHFGIITPAGSNHLVDPLDMRIPYFLQPWVVKMLEENPEFIR